MTLLPRDFQRVRTAQQALIYTAPVVEYTPSEQPVVEGPQPVSPRGIPIAPQAFVPHPTATSTPSLKVMPLLPLSGLFNTLPPLVPPQAVVARQQTKQTAWHKLSQSLQQQPFTSLRSMAYESSPSQRVDEPSAKMAKKATGREEGLQTLYVNRPMLLADDL